MVTRLRALATTIAVGAGLFSVIATSPARAEIGDSVEGHPFVLSPERRVVTAHVVVEANRAVFDDPDSVGLHLEVDPFWAELGSAAPELPVNMDKIAGPESLEGDFRDGPSCGGAQCPGRYRVTFRWPTDLDTGSVRVEWSVSFSVSYDRADPPDGAVVNVRLGQPEDRSAPKRFFEADLMLGRDAPVVMRRIWIFSTAPIADSVELALELDELHVQDSRTTTTVALLQRGRSATTLSAATSTSLDIPTRCRKGPCGFSFSLAFTLHPHDNWSGVFASWGLTSSEPVPHVAVDVEEPSTPTLTDHVSLGRIHLQGEQVTEPFAVGVVINSEALSPVEFGDLPPVIQGRVVLHADPATLAFPEGGRLESEVFFTSPGIEVGVEPDVPSFSFPRYDDNVADDELPISFVVPTGCLADLPCAFTMTVRFSTASFEGGTIDIEPTVEVVLAYPILGAAPEGADIQVNVDVGA